MLALPVYLRSGTYYLHTRVAGKQLKRSLRTSIKGVAMIRAVKVLEAFMIKKFEIDLSRGVFKADDESDFNRMVLALETIHKLGIKPTPQPPELRVVSKENSVFPSASTKSGLKLLEVLDKMILLKKGFSAATIQTYKIAISNFSAFLNNPYLSEILKSDISRYQEKLARENNSVRTIDNKTAVIRALFNFAIKQGYYFGENPAKDRSLQSKKDKIASGFSIFNDNEIKQFFESNLFKSERSNDPDYYWTVLITLFSGCRISEITGIQTKDIEFKGNYWVFRIKQSKTLAGIREIPISSKILDSIQFEEFIRGKQTLFKYKHREGKGTGNAAGKKFARHLIELGLNRDKLVFHSLRKFANDFFMRNGVSLEVRSQYFGHEIDNININFYTGKQSIERIFNQVENQQLAMAKLIQLL